MIEIKNDAEKINACIGCGSTTDLKFMCFGNGPGLFIQIALCPDCRRKLRILLNIEN